jgi:hypothetical protein
MKIGEKASRAIKFILLKHYNVQGFDYLTIQKTSTCKYYQMIGRAQTKKITNQAISFQIFWKYLLVFVLKPQGHGQGLGWEIHTLFHSLNKCTIFSIKIFFQVTDTNMPPLKQPLDLREMLIQRIINILQDRSKACIRGLHPAAQTGREAYLEQIQNMQKESDMYSELLTFLPMQVSEHISFAVVRKIIDTISEYDGQYKDLHVAENYDEEQYNTVFRNIVRSVLSPSIREYNTRDISSSFAKKLVIGTLNSIHNLTSFVLDTKTETNHSDLLASNIHHLRNLETFIYKFHSTNEVVEQLGLHCNALKFISLSNSRAVTNLCAPHLLKLSKLNYVNVSRTSITDVLYQVILINLPEIANIICKDRHENVLYNIGTENLHKIKFYRGPIINIDILTQKCSNITCLILFKVNDDISKMTALNSLTLLEIKKGNYETSNLQSILSSTGHRLMELCLYYVENVNISHIIMQCSGLKKLCIERCTFVPVDQNTVFNQQNPHFRSVIDLVITESTENEIHNHHLPYYVNLESFAWSGDEILNDDLVSEAIRQGGFENIVELYIQETGDGVLTMRTVELLIEHCERLRILGYLRRWGRLTEDDISNLKNIIKTRNLDLDIY